MASEKNCNGGHEDKKRKFDEMEGSTSYNEMHKSESSPSTPKTPKSPHGEGGSNIPCYTNLGSTKSELEL